jgi:hypothetical protein
MKELELKNETKIEISVKQKKQVEHQLIGKIIPFEGHTIWQINNETLEIEKAEFSNATYHFIGENKKEIITKKGYTYISALNKKNALKKYNQGTNGSKPINEKLLNLP